MSLQLQDRGGALGFSIKVQARARREEVVGVHAGLLRIRVTAPPVEGRANEAVVALLAQHLRVPQSSIKIAAGAQTPIKRVEVLGLDAATLLERLHLKPGGAEAS